MKASMLCPVVVFVLFASMAAPPPSAAESREELEAILGEALASGAESGALKVWVNDGHDRPVEEGTPVAAHFLSRDDLYLTVVYLDADGRVILLHPGPSDRLLRGGTQLDLPLGEATTPYGLDSLFVLGSPKPIPVGSIGVESQQGHIPIAADEAGAAVRELREIVAGLGAASVRSARIDLHIVPARSTNRGYTAQQIVRYFSEAPRSLRRPKLELEINFETGSAELLDDARAELDVFGAALTNPALNGRHFALAGHTDHQGDEAYNQRLSESRAAAARSYLVENFDIAPSRIDIQGYGETRPLMEGDDPNSLWRNRRVELELVR